MTIKVELSPETVARLTAEARDRGIPLEKAAEWLLQEALAAHSAGEHSLSVQDFHIMLDALAKGSENLPDLPTESFTRESFYQDRT